MIQKRFKTREDWFKVSEETALHFMARDYENAEAVLEEMKANPDQVVKTTWALYRYVPDESGFIELALALLILGLILIILLSTNLGMPPT